MTINTNFTAAGRPHETASKPEDNRRRLQGQCIQLDCQCAYI